MVQKCRTCERQVRSVDVNTHNPNAEELHVTSDEVPFICYTCFGLIIELDDLLNLRTFSCLMMFGGTPIMF